MEIADIQRVVEEFIKRLQLPDSSYELTTNTDNTFVEFNISLNNNLKYCLSIDNGSLRVLYSTDYTSDNYYSQKFTSPITLFYQLCIIFYSSICNDTELTFNELLSVLLLDEITNWKELVVALAENVNLSAHTENDVVTIEDIPITYDESIGCLTFGDNEFEIEKDGYTALIEALFSVVEYIANLMDKADTLFDIEVDNVIEPEQPEENPEENMGIGSPLDETNDEEMDMDSLISEDEGEEPEAVETVDNETFEEPQGPVITPDMVS